MSNRFSAKCAAAVVFLATMFTALATAVAQAQSATASSPSDGLAGRLLLSAVGSVLGPILAVLVAWLGGANLTRIWNLRQKREELALAAAAKFYDLYGEFFAIWKLWNNALHENDVSQLQAIRRELFTRSAAAEAGMEALYVRLSLNEHLSARDVDDIGRFRQAYQLLRQQIRANQSLDWAMSSHKQYLSFKRLACRIATILESKSDGAETDAYLKLRRITDNFWEPPDRWTLTAARLALPADPITPVS